MIKKISLLAAGVTFVVGMSMIMNFGGSNGSQGNQGSIIQVAQATHFNGNRKNCFWQSGCKFKVNRNCAGSNCGSPPQN